MIRRSIPLVHHWRARRMDECLERLFNLMCARVSHDERGAYVSGFGSKAISARAAERPEPWTRPWMESEGARLILRVLEDDRAGPRMLAKLWAVEGAEVEWAIVQQAMMLVPQWCEAVRSVS